MRHDCSIQRIYEAATRKEIPSVARAEGYVKGEGKYRRQDRGKKPTIYETETGK
jgi:hypothetical protein